MCANKSCKHCGTHGCTLFEGQSWRRCRKAVAAKRPSGRGASKKRPRP